MSKRKGPDDLNITVSQSVVTSAAINVYTSSTATTTTTLPPELMNLVTEQRDLNASNLMIQGNEALKPIKDELPKKISPILNNERNSVVYEKNQIIYNFYNQTFVNSKIEHISIGQSDSANTFSPADDVNQISSDLSKIITSLVEKREDDKVALMNEALLATKSNNKIRFLKCLIAGGKWFVDLATAVGAYYLIKMLGL